MNTPMSEHKVTKFKVSVASLVVGLGLVGGGYALGNGRVFNDQPAIAASSETSSGLSADEVSTQITGKAPVYQTQINPSTNTAMILSAVNYDLAQKGVAANTNKIIDLQVFSSWARGKLVNGDSGGIFYARLNGGEWTVVQSGQSPLSQDVATANGFPKNWVNQNNWYN